MSLLSYLRATAPPIKDGVFSINHDWDHNQCNLSITNTSESAQPLETVTLFDIDMPYGSDTPFYGEGYNMLSQYRGTLERLDSITPLTDKGHYKLPQASDSFVLYNMLLLHPAGESSQLVGFSSCQRFSGEIHISPERLQIVIQGEGITLAPGEALDLESIVVLENDDPSSLLREFASVINQHHPRLTWPELPTGWCSWYCYGPNVTPEDIDANLTSIKSSLPQLKYVQIDDGYQRHMGDWLLPHANFPDGIQPLCNRITEQGFTPAMWVAPFIAEPDSQLFKEHPDWFVHDDEGAPLASNTVSFGGWRNGPWYMLDGTHPDAQAYLRDVFHTMRHEWGCTYFKLDANMWGALPFGQRYDKNATSVDAYRAGMQAIHEGAGEDSFILGCNAPMWPSLGTVHGMRTTGDIHRSWNTFKQLALECFHRNWQNDLWYNDPDCLVLANLPTRVMGPDGQWADADTGITDAEFSFHLNHILASGGMILASDRMMDLNATQQACIERLLSVTGTAATFSDTSFNRATLTTADHTIHLFFNWEDNPSTAAIPVNDGEQLVDFWTQQSIPLSAPQTSTHYLTLAPRSARAITIQ